MPIIYIFSTVFFIFYILFVKGEIKMYNFRPMPNQNVGNRFLGGGFVGPFILGGITGGLLAPAFYPRPGCPYPQYPPYYYGPYPRVYY